MEKYRLHCFPESGNCYKVALMLKLCKADWEPVYVDYLNGETRDPAWRARVNDMGEIPVLEFSGRKLSQSGAILQYLSERHRRFGGRTADEKYRILRWMLFDSHKFTSYFATHRFLRALTPTPPDPAVIKFLRARIDAAFAVVERHLETSLFMAGERPTIADIAMLGYLVYPKEETGYDLPTTHPHIAGWIKSIQSFKGWRDPYTLMPGTRAKVWNWDTLPSLEKAAS